MTLREQTHAFFNREAKAATLWRLSVPPTSTPLNLGSTLIEWRGAQRWIWSTSPAAEIRTKVQAAGGHATAFRHHDRNDVFHPLAPALAQIHQRLEKGIRSGRCIQSRPSVFGPLRCKPLSLISSKTRPKAKRRTRSCASACIAASALPRARRINCSATSSTGRAAASYLIKQVLEGHEVTAKTQLHLDRCLTCRNCETTCPSGVKYGRLVDIGRKIVDDHVPRPAADRLARIALKEGVTSALFGPAMRVGQMMRPLLPRSLQDKVPPRSTHADTGPHVRMHARRCCWKAAYNRQWRRTSTPPRRACSMRLASKHYARRRPAVAAQFAIT